MILKQYTRFQLGKAYFTLEMINFETINSIVFQNRILEYYFQTMIMLFTERKKE